jgi:hypothetical protein
MKKWEETCVAGVFSVILWVILLIWGASMYLPSAYKTFLGIPYAVNPEFVDAFNLKLTLLMGGFLFLGLGLGFLGSAYTIYTFEKKTEGPHPPSP